jgi:hypothetical protein
MRIVVVTMVGNCSRPLTIMATSDEEERKQLAQAMAASQPSTDTMELQALSFSSAGGVSTASNRSSSGEKCSSNSGVARLATTATSSLDSPPPSPTQYENASFSREDDDADEETAGVAIGVDDSAADTSVDGQPPTYESPLAAAARVDRSSGGPSHAAEGLASNGPTDTPPVYADLGTTTAV